MSASGLDKINPRTIDQAREEIARKDRAGWFPATHASGQFGIIARDGAEVARCQNERDRDMILMMARSHDAMRAALEAVTDELERIATPEDQIGKVRHQARAALALARGVK